MKRVQSTRGAVDWMPGLRGITALAAVTGISLVLCGSAWGKMPQTIAFTSTPPTNAVAGGAYEVSASSSSPVPVGLIAEGACSFEAPPPAGAEQKLSQGPPEESPPPEATRAPARAHFVRSGTCIITAETWRGPRTAQEQAVYEEYEPVQPGPGAPEQRFGVAKDPLERVTFTSTAQSDATVGGSYDPSVISSEPLLVSFFSVTPSVCRIIRPEVFANREVKLEAPGTCTIIASQLDTQSEAAATPEAQQSFTVYTQPVAPTSTGTTQPVAPTDTATTKSEVKKTVANDHTVAAAPNKQLTRAAKLRKALKACKKDKGKRKRARCQASARRNDGREDRGHLRSPSSSRSRAKRSSSSHWIDSKATALRPVGR